MSVGLKSQSNYAQSVSERVCPVAQRQRTLAVKSKHLKNYQFQELLPLIASPIWVNKALRLILTNTGSRTSGVDGINKTHFLRKDGRRVSETKVKDFTQNLSDLLKSKKYRPLPVKRVYIPKPNSDEKRPLGIPTITDRVVQMLLKMVFEPIWESDFLKCSYGFRPLRRTWHAIIRLHPLVIHRYHYVIEGDIRKFFDTVNHRIMLNEVRKRIRDKDVLAIVKLLLRSGVLKDGLFSNTDLGTPQGGVCSPLLSNIYLHQFDKWFMERWGKLTAGQRSYRRRIKGLGHFILCRYADDWIVISNAKKSLVVSEREEIGRFLSSIRLELNMKKTHITHLRDGFNFLGFNIRVIPKTGDKTKPFFRITPRKESVNRFRRKIKDQTKRDSVNIDFRMKLIALNRIIRGWGYYYRYSHASKIFNQLDWYVQRRLLRWLKKKTGKGSEYCLEKYRVYQEDFDRLHWGSLKLKGSKERDIFLASLSKIGVLSDPRKQSRRFRVTPTENPYIIGHETGVGYEPSPHLTDDWQGQTYLEQHPVGWQSKSRRVRSFDVHCVACGSKTDLAVHVRRDKSEMGRLNRTLCSECHRELHKQLRESENNG